MSTYDYQYLVRSEQNKDLAKEAEFERWLSSVGPLRTSKEPLGQQLIRQAREWLERQDSLFPCNEALPECGLMPVG